MASDENKQRRCSYSCRRLAWHSQKSKRRLVVRLIINIIVPIFASLRAALASLPFRPPLARPLLLPFLHLLLPCWSPCVPCVACHPPCMSRVPPDVRPLTSTDASMTFPSGSGIRSATAKLKPSALLHCVPPAAFPTHPILIPSVVKCGRSQLRRPPQYTSRTPTPPSNIPIFRSRLFVLSGARSLVNLTANKVRAGLARSWRHGQPRCNSAAVRCVF